MAPFRAAMFGHLEAVKWFHVHYTNQFVPQVMNQAAENGHLDVVRWLNENRSEGCTGCALSGAARNGHLDVVMYLMENRTEGFERYNTSAAPNIEVQYPLSISKSSELQLKPGEDQTSDDLVATLQSIYKKRPAFVKDCLSQLAEIAVHQGNIEILDWLNQFGLELRSSIPIRDTISRGNVKLLQWFHANQFQMCDLDLVELAAQKGQLNAARWLSQQGSR